MHPIRQELDIKTGIQILVSDQYVPEKIVSAHFCQTKSVRNNLSMKIFLQEMFVQENFVQETFVQETFVQETFVQETFVYL